MIFDPLFDPLFKAVHYFLNGIKYHWLLEQFPFLAKQTFQELPLPTGLVAVLAEVGLGIRVDRESI